MSVRKEIVSRHHSYLATEMALVQPQMEKNRTTRKGCVHSFLHFLLRVKWEKPSVISTEVEYATHVYQRFFLEIACTEIGDIFIECVSHNPFGDDSFLSHVLAVGKRLKIRFWHMSCANKEFSKVVLRKDILNP